MTRKSYKQMLVESLIDISSMTSYKGPAQKVLDAKDEKFETHRSATSEVDVLGRAYAGQDDWDNKFITENNDMDEENVAQGEPNVKVTLPDGHDPDVTDLEDNIDESDPDKNYQQPITGEQDAKSKLNVEGSEDPVSVETSEDDEDEDDEDDGTITEPTPSIPTEDEFQNANPKIATEGDEDLGDDLPEDEPIDDEPVDDVSDDEDLGDDLPEDEPVNDEPFPTPEEEEPVEDEDLGDDLPEDEPVEESVEDGEVITGDQPPLLGDDLPEDEPPPGDFPEEHLDEGDEDLGDDLPEDEPVEDDGVPEDDGEDLGDDLPEDEPVEDDSDFQTEDDSTEQEIDDEFEDSDDEPTEDDVITDEPSDIDTASDNNQDLPQVEEGLGAKMLGGAAAGSIIPGVGSTVGAIGGAASHFLGQAKNVLKAHTEYMSGNAIMEDVAMDPNANLGAPPPAAPAPMPPAPPPGDPNAAPPPGDSTMDPNAAPPPGDPNAAGAPADPNAPVDPNDPNAQAQPGEGENPDEQDPILDVDSNVVASDTSTPQEDNQQPVPTQESVMESLITELGSYMDTGNADMKDLLSQDVDD